MSNGRDRLDIWCAGSLEQLVRNRLAPHFEASSGLSVSVRSGGSRALARGIGSGTDCPEVFLSADPQVIEAELMRGKTPPLVSWYLTFAANSLVLVWSECSAAASFAKSVRDGTRSLVELLEEGFRLGRPDPEEDPKGYRTLFALELLARHTGRVGLAARVLGTARNPGQVLPSAELVPRLRRGELDLVFAYRSQAVAEALPLLELPPETDLGSLEHAGTYANASYTCEDGTSYRGAPIAYAAALPSGARNVRGAACFLAFLTTPTVQRLLAEYGFRPVSGVTVLHQDGLRTL